VIPLLPLASVVAVAAEAETGVVMGTVRDADGAPVSGTVVVLQAGGVAIRRQTDARGAYQFPEVAPGAWEIRAGGGTWEQAVVAVPVDAGRITLQDVVVEAAPALPYVERPRRPEMTVELPARTDADVQWARLESGLRVIVAGEDGADVGAIATLVPAGARHDPEGREGMARLAAELWLDTEIADGMTVREAHQRLGAEARVVVGADHTLFLVEAPAATLPLLLAMEGQRFTGPLAGVSGSDVAHAARFPASSQADGLLGAGGADAVFDALYPEAHPYHGLADRPDLADLGVEEVRSWAERHWTLERSWMVLEGGVGSGAWVAESLAWYGGWPKESGSGPRVADLTRAEAALPAAPGPADAAEGDVRAVWVAWSLPGVGPTSGGPDATPALTWASLHVSAAIGDRFRGARCDWLLGFEATTFACLVPTDDAERATRSIRAAVRQADDDLARHLEGWQQEEIVAALHSLGDPVGRRALARARGAARTGVADFAALRAEAATLTPKEARALLREHLSADRAVVVPVR
jgi:hypothetical protein